MISSKTIIGIVFIIIIGSMALISKWQARQKRLEFEREMAEIERSTDILRKISSKLDSMDENEKVDSKKVAELEELTKELQR